MNPEDVRRRFPEACRYCAANRPHFGNCFGEIIDGRCMWDEEGIRERIRVIRMRETEKGRTRGAREKR
ncbi:hypothetical protein ACI3L3_10220 [Desulfobaculum sp. SPO524]|uniref:hypothetical protein n=1 Tax=Desulfobaculum sp. SPO524 TaxID=3378071 RepID=UPI0038555782